MCSPLFSNFVMPTDNLCQAQALCANSGSVFVTKDSLQTAINDYLFDSEVATDCMVE
jgi:hypothetical protein